MIKYFLLLLGLFSLVGCSTKVKRISSTIPSLNKQDPALSGNGQKLAFIADKNGRYTVQLIDVRKQQLLPLRYLSRHQPHSSPSISWNARYIAVITQNANKRTAVIEDRVSGKIHKLIIPGGYTPSKLSLSDDGSKIAIQFIEKGKSSIRIFDLSKIIRPDKPSNLKLSKELSNFKL